MNDETLYETEAADVVDFDPYFGQADEYEAARERDEDYPAW